MTTPETRRVGAAAPHPCDRCPWRTANQQGPDPHGFYRPANLARLWRWLRRGERMTCHPTDPTVAEHGAPPGAETRECAGALILQGREVMRFQDGIRADDAGDAAYRRYQRSHPFGMTLRGIAVFAQRALFDGPLSGQRVDRVDLNEDGIGYSPLADWEVRR